jgi:hypothetical protein
MKTVFLSFFLLVSLRQAHANSNITDILFNRAATFEERQSVSETLSHLGKQRPLVVMDAIAEVCYEVDLCAGLTTVPPVHCEEIGSSAIGDECYPTFFNENYACNDELAKQSDITVKLAGRLLFDLHTMYNSYISDYMVDGLSRQYNVDFRELIKNPAALEEYLRLNPNVRTRIEKISEDALSMAAYTLDCYGLLNRILYTKNQPKINRYFNLLKGIINTMGLFPEFKGKVNRGVMFPAAILKEHHKIGNIVCYDGFTSTAIHDPKTDMTDKPKNGFLSGKCTQRLYINYDERALGGKNISKASTSKSEDEILFEPGSCFRIDNIFPRTDPPTEDDVDVECNEGEHYNFEMTLVR